MAPTQSKPIEPSTSSRAKRTTAKTASDDANKKRRGQGYTDVEDVLVARAFIAASNDAIRGSDMRGAFFHKQLHKCYHSLLVQHEKNASYLEYVHAKIDAAGRDTESYSRLGSEPGEAPQIYPRREVKSVADRWSLLQTRVNKLFGLYSSVQVKSGDNDESQRMKATKSLYKTRYPNYPWLDSLEAIHGVLKNSPKWAVLSSYIDEEEATKTMNTRPKGKKAVTKQMKQETMVESIIKKSTSLITPAQPPKNDNDNGVLGDALKQIADGFMASFAMTNLTPESRADYLRATSKRMILQEQVKRRKLEEELALMDERDTPQETGHRSVGVVPSVVALTPHHSNGGSGGELASAVTEAVKTTLDLENEEVSSEVEEDIYS